jgi:hypothetical protein
MNISQSNSTVLFQNSTAQQILGDQDLSSGDVGNLRGNSASGRQTQEQPKSSNMTGWPVDSNAYLRKGKCDIVAVGNSTLFTCNSRNNFFKRTCDPVVSNQTLLGCNDGGFDTQARGRMAAIILIPTMLQCAVTIAGCVLGVSNN